MSSPATAPTVPSPYITTPETLGTEAVSLLQSLIRIDTMNPPGNERLVADALARIFEAEGIPYEIVDSAPGRASIVARIASSNPTGRPVLLMGHVDVVTIERDKWERDPFGGDLVDGYVWGRGALDMKGQVAAELAAFLAIKRSGVALTRDLIFAAFADEEAGGEFGAAYVWEHRRDLIDAEFAINEGGGRVITVEGKPFFTCQAGEKGGSALRVTATGSPGHASTPLPVTAMGRMGRALTAITERRGETVITAPVRMLLEGVAESDVSDGLKATIRDLLNAEQPTVEQVEALGWTGAQGRTLLAITRNTSSPTIIHGGHRQNVIPSEIELTVDGRLLPGADPEQFRQEIQDLVGEGVTVELTSRGSGIAADPASPFFDAITATMDELLAGVPVLPTLTAGITDARLVPGIKVYGFFPKIPSERAEIYGPLVHGHNERVHVDDIAFGAQFLHDVIVRFSAA